ncbi:MAG: glycosyltransferase, partial [Lachnospiraceae bacterium]|nr:glycosyltransferase [Lachnospiraceae bacterium]
MKLVFDCFKQVKGVGKSIGIYNLTLNTIRNMAAEKARSIDPRVQEAELVVIGSPYNEEDFAIDGVEFISITDLDPRKKAHALIWELFRVSKVCKQIGADRVVFPRGYTALTHPIKDTAIINDMIPFYYHEHYPNYFNKLENAYIMRRLLQSAKSAEHIVTISEASKDVIREYVKVPEEKITVLYPGCNLIEPVTNVEENPEFTQSGDYMIAVTSSFPHKNAKGIVSCYQAYYRKSQHPMDLVIIGLKDLQEYEIDEEIKSHIKCYKYVPSNRDMHLLISKAKLFLFLSVA